jgi:Fe2+ transport system protein FeoA
MPERNGKTPMLPALQRVADLPAGSVVRLSCRELSQGEACLLAAMGMTEGCRLTVRTSGDPCIVEVRSTRIGLARSVAARLFVASDPSAVAGDAAETATSAAPPALAR